MDAFENFSISPKTQEKGNGGFSILKTLQAHWSWDFFMFLIIKEESSSSYTWCSIYVILVHMKNSDLKVLSRGVLSWMI